MFYSAICHRMAQMVGAFSQPRPYIRLFIGVKNDRPKPNLPKLTKIHLDVQRESANRKTSFSGREKVLKKMPFSGHIANKFRRPTILQLNIKSLTASKINVLHYLALQFEAHPIQETTVLMQRSKYFQITS